METPDPHVVTNMANRHYHKFIEYLIRHLSRQDLLMSTGHEIEQQIEAGEWEGYSEKQVWDIFGKIADNIADNVAKYHKIVHPRSCGTVFCEIFEDANYEDPIKISKYLTVSYVIAMSAHESKGFRRMLRVKKGIFR